MNANEGLTRIAQVVRWIGNGLSWLLVVGIVLTPFSDKEDKWTTAGFLFGGIVFFWATSAGLAWIIEGFAAPKQ